MKTKTNIHASIDVDLIENLAKENSNLSQAINDILTNYFDGKQQNAVKNLKLISDLQNDIAEIKESLYSIENKVDLTLLTDNFVSRIQMAELGLALKQLDEKGAGEILDSYRESIQDLTKKITSLALPATPTIKPKNENETKTN
jgi:hydrogenase maturation factor